MPSITLAFPAGFSPFARNFSVQDSKTWAVGYVLVLFRNLRHFTAKANPVTVAGSGRM